MFFIFTGLVVVIGVAAFLAYAGMFLRDKALEAKENLSLWHVVPLKDMTAENADLYLILPIYGKPKQFEIKKGGDEGFGRLNAQAVPAEMTFGPRVTLVHLPEQGDGAGASASDSIVFWAGGIIEGEIFPLIGTVAERRYALVTGGKEYEVRIPAGSEREVGRVVIDDVTVAEFARADRLSIGRARLLAVSRGEPLEMMPFLVWLAVYR